MVSVVVRPLIKRQRHLSAARVYWPHELVTVNATLRITLLGRLLTSSCIG